ncbi:MAG: AEC family transporter [Opitutaceae bacterium]|nr:AEC family transporter [Verrucomicrobiales bacterium]
MIAAALLFAATPGVTDDPMREFLTVLTAVLPVFCIAGAGVLLRKINWLTEEADQSLLRVTINLLSPCLIFDKILQNEALRQPSNVFLPPIVGFATVAVGLWVGRFGARFAGLKDQRTVGTFALCVGLYNYGYFPLPLAETLFDRETVGVLFVHNLGVEIAMWTLGIVVISGAKIGSGWRKVLNPPVIAILAALLFNALHGYEWIPSFVILTAKMLGQCAIPMGLILIGAIVADHLREFHSTVGWRVVLTGSVLRLGLLPIGFLLLARYLPCTIELKRVIVLQGAMSSAVFPIAMARHYNGDPATALRVVIGTSVIGFVTIPIWIRLGMKFVDL